MTNDDHGRALATKKFNFLAWAARISNKRALGATDLMVLVQLVVRYDPKFPRFTMSAEAIANATNAGVSTVRRSLKNLQRLGDIECVSRPGRSNAYRVNFDRAKPGWVQIKKAKLEKIRRERRGETVDQELEGHLAKKLAPTVRKRDDQARQKVSAVSISSKHDTSKHSSSNSQEGSEFFECEVGQGPIGHRDEGAQETNDNPARKAFRSFLKIWPKIDANEEIVWRTWKRHVVKAKVDPEVVLREARAWKAYLRRDPDAYLYFPGRWLAETGWEFHRAPKGPPRWLE